MEVGVETTKLYSKNGWKIEIKGTERSKHSCSRKHNVKMTYNIKRIMKKDIHSRMSNTHSTNSTRNEEENKCQYE